MRTQNPNQTKHWSQLDVGEWLERETAASRWFKRAPLPPLANPGAAIKLLQPISWSNLLSIIDTHSEQTAHTFGGGGTEQHHIYTHTQKKGQGHNNILKAALIHINLIIKPIIHYMPSTKHQTELQNGGQINSGFT